jgi:hypothetical protein
VFGAPKNASVFGTAVQSTPFSLAGGKAAFGGLRNRGEREMLDVEDEDDDEESGDGRQKVELMEGSISLEQVRSYSRCAPIYLTDWYVFFNQARRIALQSAWRGARG